LLLMLLTRTIFILVLCSSKCDGFMVASNKTDVALGTVDIPHEGPEEYNNIWQKVRSMWSYVYDNYYEKYDWYVCRLASCDGCIRRIAASISHIFNLHTSQVSYRRR